MWSFANGSGLHGGGGYISSQGWEFVPCSRMDRADRGRGKSRSSLRRISSPPAVFSQLHEPQLGASQCGGEGGSGARLEHLRGQIWPGPEAQQQQQQTQHLRLKKKFEELKKRHVQDREGWMREKESLLREVADIQGGENRRILLDLKTVLEEVQLEVKKEEEKRSELQLQYTRDRCSWELEKAELKCRISQLEAREGAGLISGGAQPVRRAREQHGETSTPRREREEQRRLLDDTHSTAMDLRCRLEPSARDWSREKAELLERFDVERREWESQLKGMQKKIEELYCEVRTKREGTGPDGGRRDDEDDVMCRLSIRSTSTGSSLLSDNTRSDPHSSSCRSEPNRRSPLPGLARNSDTSHHSTCFQGDSLCGPVNAGGRFPQNDHSQHELVDELTSRGAWRQLSVTDSKQALDTKDLDGVFLGAPGRGVPRTNVSKGSGENVHGSLRQSPLCAEPTYGSDRKKNTSAVNAALKEIARVSEELCSYQDEIRKKSGDTRDQSESLCLEETNTLFGHDNTRLEVDEGVCDLSQIYNDFLALEKEKWITLLPDNTWWTSRGPSKAERANTADPDRETSPRLLSELDTTAPPVPPRVSSWNLCTPTPPDTELHIPESPTATMGNCHNPRVLLDRKCSSPSIVRKFGAMLQENEGKVLIDGVVASCSVPENSKCNISCCHSRGSCDASKFPNSRSSSRGTVQESFSEVNIVTAGKGLRSDCSTVVGELKDLQMPAVVRALPVDLLLPSLEISPASLKTQGSRRNVMLEQKTAEFNRTLFQAEMGHSVEEHDSLTVTDACPVGRQPACSATCASDEVLPPRETTFQPQCTDITPSATAVHPEVTLSLSTSDSPVLKVEARGMSRCPERQEIKMSLSSEPPQFGHKEATIVTSQGPVHHSEVKHTVQTASNPPRKSQQRAATEALVSEPVLPVNIQLGQNVDSNSSKNENPSEAKPQSVTAGVSLQQPYVENKQRQMTQLRHVSVPPSQSDSRLGPRMMNDHPWKTLTLAAYPRPEGSRSNYGAVERILRNYESAARAQQSQSQEAEVSSSTNSTNRVTISVGQEKTLTELDMLDMDPLPLPPTLTHTQTHSQLSSYSSMCVKELHRTVQDNKESSVSSSSGQKNFSRPTRPANRRLPSRWASHSPASSSPSTTPVVPLSFPLHKHSFTYFQIEAVTT